MIRASAALSAFYNYFQSKLIKPNLVRGEVRSGHHGIVTMQETGITIRVGKVRSLISESCHFFFI
jgi:hypothetical protein